ncbi:16S rRNA (guanine(1207)-N(2))-methyltransferase RsmC [Orbaceae bacterium ac157xtp]
MFAQTPASQILARHEDIFADKTVLISGDFHDDYPVLLKTKQSFIHCSQYHIYQELFSRKVDNVNIEFGVYPNQVNYAQIDTLIYYWTKNKVEAKFQLSFLLNSLAKNVDIFIVGENRIGVNSAEKLLSDFGSITKIDSARRCSLYHFSAESRLAFDEQEWWTNYKIEMNDFEVNVCGLPGIFSQKNLDQGTELLLESVLDRPEIVKGAVLDLGCGSGVLTAFLAKLNPSITPTATDVSAAALASTNKTLAENNITANVIASDVFSDIDGRFDLIISNPPFHDGKETSYKAVETLIAQAKNHLNKGGKLCIVANTFLPYQQLLSNYFNKVDLITSTTKFKVYCVS